MAFLGFAFLTVQFHLASPGIKDVSPQKPFNPCDSVTPRGGSISEQVLSCGGKAGTQKATCCLSLYPVGPLPVHPGGPGAQECLWQRKAPFLPLSIGRCGSVLVGL